MNLDPIKKNPIQVNFDLTSALIAPMSTFEIIQLLL